MPLHPIKPTHINKHPITTNCYHQNFITTIKTQPIPRAIINLRQHTSKLIRLIHQRRTQPNPHLHTKCIIKIQTRIILHNHILIQSIKIITTTNLTKIRSWTTNTITHTMITKHCRIAHRPFQRLRNTRRN